MKRGFLSQKGGWGERGIKEKSGIVPSAKAVKDTVVVSSYVVEEPVDNTVNTDDLWFKLYGVPVTAFSEDGLSAIATRLVLFDVWYSSIHNMANFNWGRSSYARAMIEVRADVELKDTIVVAMPKLTREGFYTCTVRVEYEWKPPRCTCCKVFGHTQEECPKNPCLGVAKILNKPSHDPKGVLPTANISGNKKKGVEPTKEVSNSNPIDGLNSVDNDGELGTNGGTSNLASNGANSSGSSFWNVETSSTSTTPIVNYPGDHDSEDERDSYENGDYDEDPYDDDMYEGQDIPNKIQDICDNLDIRVRCRRKK
ncbi:hypothetical protein Tco_0636110 [Tanacetum coccineum]